jgi:hypothetical protein
MRTSSLLAMKKIFERSSLYVVFVLPILTGLENHYWTIVYLEELASLSHMHSNIPTPTSPPPFQSADTHTENQIMVIRVLSQTTSLYLGLDLLGEDVPSQLEARSGMSWWGRVTV